MGGTYVAGEIYLAIIEALIEVSLQMWITKCGAHVMTRRDVITQDSSRTHTNTLCSILKVCIDHLAA